MYWILTDGPSGRSLSLKLGSRGCGSFGWVGRIFVLWLVQCCEFDWPNGQPNCILHGDCSIQKICSAINIILLLLTVLLSIEAQVVFQLKSYPLIEQLLVDIKCIFTVTVDIVSAKWINIQDSLLIVVHVQCRWSSSNSLTHRFSLPSASHT